MIRCNTPPHPPTGFRSVIILLKWNYLKVPSRSGGARWGFSVLACEAVSLFLGSVLLLLRLNSPPVDRGSASEMSHWTAIDYASGCLPPSRWGTGRIKTLFLLPDNLAEVKSSLGPFELTDYDLEIIATVVIMRIISQRATLVKRYRHYHQSAVKAGWGIVCLWQQRHLQMSDGRRMMKEAWVAINQDASVVYHPHVTP